jgi:sodium/proline symporter
VQTAGGEESALMVAANELFHPVIAGLVIASVLSAIMSTVDSQLLVAASTVTYDLGLGGATHQNLLARSRLVVLLLSTGAVVTALVVDESIFRLVLFAWSSMGSAFGPLLLVTVLLGPVSRAATLWSMSLGFSLSAGAYVLGKLGLLGALAGWGGALERVLPFFVALAVALRGRSSRSTADGPT